MKKSIITFIAAMCLTMPSFASHIAHRPTADIATSVAGSYDEELYGRNKPARSIDHQVEVNAGYITAGKLRIRDGNKVQTNLSRPTLEVVYGARFSDFLFAGLGVGLQYAYGDCNLLNAVTDKVPESWGTLSIPIYANIKAYIPNKSVVMPYLCVGIGGSVVALSNFSREGYGSLRGGLFMKFGAGMTISRFNFGLGMNSQSIKWLNNEGATNMRAGNNAFYIEAGVMF